MFLSLVIALAASAGASSLDSAKHRLPAVHLVQKAPGPEGVVPPPRPGGIAIREEFDAALAAGTADAYLAFLARHPDHPLADTLRARLYSEDELPAAAPLSADPDAEVRRDFARAVAEDTSGAYLSFMEKHPAHPLAREAERRLDRL